MTLQEMITRLQLLAQVYETEGSTPDTVYCIMKDGTPITGVYWCRDTLTDGSVAHNATFSTEG